MKKITLFVLLITIISFLLAFYSINVNSSLSSPIVRLHVIANSNSDGDQLLKYQVRDAILEKSKADFTKKDEVIGSLSSYKEIAEEVIAKYGCDYSVNVQYGNFHFPTKHYENISLPAGKYDAVRVVIGEGKGENWWCVLFPPLCFVDGTTDASSAEEKMQAMLGEEGYNLISKDSQKELPVNIKFKIVELYGKLNTKEKIYAKS